MPPKKSKISPQSTSPKSSARLIQNNLNDHQLQTPFKSPLRNADKNGSKETDSSAQPPSSIDPAEQSIHDDQKQPEPSSPRPQQNDHPTTPTSAASNKTSRTYTPDSISFGSAGKAASYNSLKSFNNQIYTGMAVGGSHTWNYDPGVWKETKVEPDLWKIDYETTKRRDKNAPVGSGAPVGTEYHWVIVAHQYVRKEDANTYSTHLTGSKYKLAHKNSTSNSWSVPTVKGQREREIELLEDAKRRVEGLPPVTGSERVKVEKVERGQVKLDALFGKAGGSSRGTVEKNEGGSVGKRKRDEGDELDEIEKGNKDQENVNPDVKRVRQEELGVGDET